MKDGTRKKRAGEKRIDLNPRLTIPSIPSVDPEISKALLEEVMTFSSDDDWERFWEKHEIVAIQTKQGDLIVKGNYACLAAEYVARRKNKTLLIPAKLDERFERDPLPDVKDVISVLSLEPGNSHMRMSLPKLMGDLCTNPFLTIASEGQRIGRFKESENVYDIAKRLSETLKYAFSPPAEKREKYQMAFDCLDYSDLKEEERVARYPITVIHMEVISEGKSFANLDFSLLKTKELEKLKKRIKKIGEEKANISFLTSFKEISDHYCPVIYVQADFDICTEDSFFEKGNSLLNKLNGVAKRLKAKTSNFDHMPFAFKEMMSEIEHELFSKESSEPERKRTHRI